MRRHQGSSLVSLPEQECFQSETGKIAHVMGITAVFETRTTPLTCELFKGQRIFGKNCNTYFCNKFASSALALFVLLLLLVLLLQPLSCCPVFQCKLTDNLAELVRFGFLRGLNRQTHPYQELVIPRMKHIQQNSGQPITASAVNQVIRSNNYNL